MKSVKLYVFLGSVLVLAVPISLLLRKPGVARQHASSQPLVLYCAADVNPPIAEVVKDYQNELGVTVSVQCGGSGTLLSNLRVAQTGDLYLAADASYIEIARAHGVIVETIL